MSGFGWNFYGFFVVAAAWIAAYFAWAWWMEGRETNTERTQNEQRTNTETAARSPKPEA